MDFRSAIGLNAIAKVPQSILIPKQPSTPARPHAGRSCFCVRATACFFWSLPTDIAARAVVCVLNCSHILIYPAVKDRYERASRQHTFAQSPISP
jgi:hypothetical protein